MPMNRYEIRDEYSLADPELYRAADRDDPEALLEGVAMAGMVGVLRQLGDLAEFAAEIFHDLHEEVMATAARGHNLKVRVQQLEAEIPSIEKAFLSQTDLSSFFYNAGVDWRANLQLGQNLVTQGDLPRFVMDSYEECRGPPRLFLLDKFDVAGAGACLTRYTDPSFFKVETSATATTAAVQREKKIRKTKKKGPRGRYGETPEMLQSSSHAKLHQLLLEESVEYEVTKPAYRARLKRRPNGFPFNMSGKSYMEELLKNPSPEHKMLHENIVSSPLQMPIDDQNESVFELGSVSPARESEARKSNPSFEYREEIMPNPSRNQTYDTSADINKTYLKTDGLQPTSDEETGGKDIAIYGEREMEGSLIGYQSDEVASEIDNYVDAPSTMESEMDTDSELRVKKEPLVSVTNQEHCHSMSLDSLSTGDLSISDEGNNNSYKKETSSFLSSDSPRTSAENPRSEKLSPNGFPSDIPEIVILKASSFERNPDVLNPAVANHTSTGKDMAPENRTDFEQPTSSLCSTNSDPTLPNYDSRAAAEEGSIRGAKSDETVSNSDDDEKKRDLILDSPCSSDASHSKSLDDDSHKSSSGEHLVDREVPCVSTHADIIYHTSDSLDAISAYLVHDDDYDQMEFDNMPSTNTDFSISRSRIDTEAIASKENQISGKLDNKVAKLTDKVTNDYTDISHDGYNVASEVSERDAGDQVDLYDEVPNVVSETVDSGDHYSNNSNVNQIGAETVLFVGHPPISQEGDPVTHDKDFTPERSTTIIGTSELETPDTSEVMGLQIAAITDDINRNDLTAVESSYCMPENLEDSSGISYTAEKDGPNPNSAIAGLQLTEISWSPSRKLTRQVSEPLQELSPRLESSYGMPENLEGCSGISYTAEKDGVNPDSAIAGLQLTEISWSTSRKLPSQVSEPLEELDTSKDQPENARMTCSTPAIYDNTISDNVSSPAGLSKLVEEHVPCSPDPFERDNVSGFNREPEVEEEENCDISGSPRESSLVEEADEREAAALDFAAVCRTKHDDFPEPEVSHTHVSSYLDSEVNHRVDIVNSSHILTPLEQSGLDTEEESFQQSGLENQVSDADSLHIGSVAEDSILPESIELPSSPVDNELPDSSETISSELSSVFPTSQLQIPDHDNDKGFDNFASLFPPPAYPPPSVSVLPGLRDSGTDATACPTVISGFIFPPGNLFPEVNPKSPSLPPLPPLQWRIGKLQHASSSMEVEKLEMKEVLPEAIVPPEKFSGNVSTMPQQTKQHQAQSPRITIKEENLEHGSPSLEANPMHETINLPQKIENEQEHPQQELWNPTKESKVPSPAEEVEVAEPVQLAPESALKEENPEDCSSTFEADSMNQAVDPSPEVRKEQKQQLHLILPIQESEVPSPAVDDGASNGSRTMKLPRSCNPVIGSVAALDKSRLRKVTEQVRPEIQKQDERDALLDQIRAKSFNLKPTATSRPIIQAPNTNLNVAAILEKANAIRQALAGSDEDDEDWSDS